MTGLCGRERELIHVAFDVWNAIDSDKGNGSRKNADEARKPMLKKYSENPAMQCLQHPNRLLLFLRQEFPVYVILNPIFGK